MKTFTEITGIASVVENQQLVFEAEDKPKGIFALLGWANAFFKGDSNSSSGSKEHQDILQAKSDAKEDKRNFKKTLKEKQKSLKNKAKLIQVQAERAKNKRIYDDILAGYDDRIKAADAQVNLFKGLIGGKGVNRPDATTIQQMCDLAIQETGVKPSDDDGESKSTKLMVAALLDAKTGQPLKPIMKKNQSGDETDEIDTEATTKMYNRNAVRQWATCGLLTPEQVTDLGIDEEMLNDPNNARWKDQFEDSSKEEVINKVLSEVHKNNPAMEQAIKDGEKAITTGGVEAVTNMLAETVTGSSMDKELKKRTDLMQAKIDVANKRQEADEKKAALDSVSAAAATVNDNKNVVEAFTDEGKVADGKEVRMSADGKQLKIGDVVYDVNGGIPTKAKNQNVDAAAWYDVATIDTPIEAKELKESDFSGSLFDGDDHKIHLTKTEGKLNDNPIVKSLREAGFSDAEIEEKINGKGEEDIRNELESINEEIRNKANEKEEARKEAIKKKPDFKDVRTEADKKRSTAQTELNTKVQEYNNGKDPSKQITTGEGQAVNAEDISKTIEQIDKDLETEVARIYDKQNVNPPTDATVDAEISECNKKINKANDAVEEATAAFSDPKAKTELRHANNAEYNGVYDKVDARDLMQDVEISEKDAALKNPDEYTYIDKDGKEKTVKKPDASAKKGEPEYDEYYDNLSQHFATKALSDEEKAALDYKFSKDKDGNLKAYDKDGKEIKDESGNALSNEAVKDLMTKQIKVRTVQDASKKARADMEKSIADAQKALDTNPNDAEAKKKLDKLEEQMDKMDKAEKGDDIEDDDEELATGDAEVDSDEDDEVDPTKKKKIKNPAKEYHRKKNPVTGKPTKRYYNQNGDSISEKEYKEKVEKYKKALQKKKQRDGSASLIITKQNKVFEIRNTEYKRIVKETKEPSKFTFTKLSQLKK